MISHFSEGRSRTAVEVAEQFADGFAGIEGLFVARDDAFNARSMQDGNFYTVDAGWYCAQEPANAYWCSDSCAHAAGLGTVATVLGEYDESREVAEFVTQSHFLRDIFGNPFRPVTFPPAWRSDTAVSLAKHIYESRDFNAMPILADALQDAGCDNDDILTHCRNPEQVHVRGCWVVDLVLGKS